MIEKLRLLADLFEAYGELYVRMEGNKFVEFDRVAQDMSAMQGEIDKRGATEGLSSESVRRLTMRLELLRRECETHQTHNKFIQYCVLDEMEWVHAHKAVVNHLFNQLLHLTTLKNRQWSALFDAERGNK